MTTFKIYATRVDVPNVNGHIYSKEAVEKMADHLNNYEKPVLVEMNPDKFPNQSDDNVDLTKACCKVERGSAKIEDGMLVYNVTTIDNDMGEVFKSLPNMSIGCVAIGDLDENKVLTLQKVGKLHTLKAEDAGFKQREIIE